MLSNSFGIEPYNPYEDKGMWSDFFDAVILSEPGGRAEAVAAHLSART